MEIPIEIDKIWALTKRDMRLWRSYKSAAITAVLGGLLGITSWGLNATYRNVAVPQYNTDYVSFLITGILVTNLILPISQGLQSRFNPWTLETVLMTGLRSSTLVLGSVGWTYILSVLLFIPQMILGVFVFGAHLVINPISLIVAVLLSTIVVFSIAMISTGLRIVTKVSDPVTWGLGVAASVFAGVTFPIQHLNSYLPGLSDVSWILPQTWIYDIVRLSSLEGASLLEPSVAEAFLVTLCFGLVLLVLGAHIFRWGLIRAKKDGSLGWY